MPSTGYLSWRSLHLGSTDVNEVDVLSICDVAALAIGARGIVSRCDERRLEYWSEFIQRLLLQRKLGGTDSP